jgi:hypothetical protein
MPGNPEAALYMALRAAQSGGWTHREPFVPGAGRWSDQRQPVGLSAEDRAVIFDRRVGRRAPEIEIRFYSTARAIFCCRGTATHAKNTRDQRGRGGTRKNDMYGPEMLIRGVGDAIQVTESPLPKLLAGRPREDRATWERVGLELVRLLIVTNCVEQIDLVALRVENGKLVHVDFRGTRHASSGCEPFVIEINDDVNF